MMKKTARSLPNVHISVFENKYAVQYAAEVGAQYLIRGERNEADYLYERQMRYTNGKINPHVTTVFLIPPKELTEVSSSFVKELIGPESWEDVVEGYVPRWVYNTFLVKNKGLYSRWSGLCDRTGADERRDSVYAELVRLYGDSKRAYHNMIHLAHAFRELDSVRDALDDPDAVELALWFHDAIFDTHAIDNEEQSAELAKKAIAHMGVGGSIGEKVGVLIIPTKHLSVPVDHDAQYIVDIDIAGFGKPRKEFDENTYDVREEYDWASDEAFKKGRSEVLKIFVDRKEIYCTKEFREKYEIRARENLESALYSG